MRYFKFSILTGIGLFAISMFFLSQSIQGFLSLGDDSTQIDDEVAALDISLAESAEFPDLNLDFPAGVNQSETVLPPESTLPSQTSPNPLRQTAGHEPHQGQTQHTKYLPENNTPKIKLVTIDNPQADAPEALGILLLTQTTRQQRTTLIEELLRIDAELVRQIALKPTDQQNISAKKVQTVQQISLTDPASQQTVSAGFASPQSWKQNPPPQDRILIQKDNPIRIVASYRGATIKTIGTPIQNGVLNQTIQVVPLLSNIMLHATVLNQNLAQLDIDSELPLPEELRNSSDIKLSQMGEFQPAEIIKISGTGLVVGLNGTGDRLYSEEAIKALNSSVATMNINLKEIKTPIKAGNLAKVSIVAYVPNQGVNKGQRLECYVTAANQGVDLKGGYLLPTALLDAGSGRKNADAVVAGAVLTDQSQTKSQGMIAHGAQILSNISPKLISGEGIPHLKFFLNAPSNRPHTSQLITQRINHFLQSQNSVNSKAILRSSSMIMISLPNSDSQQAQKLAAQLLTLSMPAQLSAALNQPPEVLIDHTKLEIQTRGNVLLQPTKIEHSDLTLELSSQTATRLNDLLALMQHVHIPRAKQIEFLRELQQQGKIRATYREF